MTFFGSLFDLLVVEFKLKADGGVTINLAAEKEQYER